ncbi:MAG: hypothetical protein AAF206_20755 [Bacteroidota bacterium]
MKHHLYILFFTLLFSPSLMSGQNTQAEWEKMLTNEWTVQPFGQAAGMPASQCSSGKLIALQASGKMQIESCLNGQRSKSSSNWQIASPQEGIWTLKMDGINYQIQKESLASRIRLKLSADDGQKLIMYRLVEMKDVPVPEGEETH